MKIPSNVASIQGVTQIGADQLNTFAQVCDTAAELATFVGFSNMIVLLLGLIAPNDGGQGAFYWASGSFKNDGINTIVPNGVTNGAWLRLVLSPNGGWISPIAPVSPHPVLDVITPEIFGAVGDGVADDTAAITKFYANVSGRIGYMPGQYKLTTILNLPTISNCKVIGIPGQTILTGNFGYAIIQWGARSNVHHYGVTFQTTYTNAVADNGTAVTYSRQNNISNVSFERCTWTSPHANTSGYVDYLRDNSAGNNPTAVGLWIVDCDFVNVGRIGITLMNRQDSPDAYTAFRHVYILRNRFDTLGTDSSGGMAVSLDTFGSDFHVNENSLSNCLLIGLENTNWISGEMKANTFRNFVGGRVWAPMSFSRGTATWQGNPAYMTDVKIEDNICIDKANSRSNFIGMIRMSSRGNVFNATGDFAFHERDATYCVHVGDVYTSDNVFAALIGLQGVTTQNNQWTDCKFDDSASASNFAVVRFSGSATTLNQINGATILKGTGGFIVDQDPGGNPSSNNMVWDYSDASGLVKDSYSVVNLPDSNWTAVTPYDCIHFGGLRFNGTLTAQRTLTFPASTFRVPTRIRNTTGQTLQFNVGSTLGDTIANATYGTAVYDDALGSIRVMG